ncbi:expansin-B18-like, partial [Zingiber officinale]|uniref:expansin-B18-like n=1 Tax=Zingiber officinale TaxID=94328 RepID=UPI001C4DD067
FTPPLAGLHWSPAGATWYGAPDGPGSTGGACAYADAVVKAPLSSMITAGGPSLFRGGRGCGACYQVLCNSNAACSGRAVTVVVTDECSSGICVADLVHFDLSGAAFGAMEKPGQAEQLRNAGSLAVEYTRVPCHYPGITVAFRVDAGSNADYLAVVIENVNGDGELAAMKLKEGSSKTWMAMQPSWGAQWKFNPGRALHPPFSFHLTSGQSKKILVAHNVIPVGWTSGSTYTSKVNY